MVAKPPERGSRGGKTGREGGEKVSPTLLPPHNLLADTTQLLSWPDQFIPGSLTILRDLAPATSALEYPPAQSADRHRPEAHCRRLSISSPAVTATGTAFRG